MGEAFLCRKEQKVPKGIITMWSGLISAIPTGWVLCNGQNGTPDLRDRFILSVTTGEEPGGTGGSHSVTLTEAQMPTHNHTGSTNTTGAHTHTVGVAISNL